MVDEKNPQAVLEKNEVLKVLEKNLGAEERFRLNDYAINPAGDEFAGFLGEHYALTANVTVLGEIKKLRYFVKKIPARVPQHREYALKTGAFYKEVESYKTLFEDLKNSRKDLKNPTKWHPEFFYSRDVEILVLEDLSEAGYYMYPERSLMDEEHVGATLDALAAMHAASFVFERKFNDGQIESLSPTFERTEGIRATVGDVYSHLTFETEASDVPGHPGNAFYEAGLKALSALVDVLPGYGPAEKTLIREKLPAVLKDYFRLVKKSDRFANVFVHGDLWANNVLFRKDESGKVRDAVLVDFQLIRYAPPAHDVMMFLHLVQSEKFIEGDRARLLRRYHGALTSEMEKSGLAAEEILPWETFLESCEFYDDLGSICKIFFFQLILAPSHVTRKFLSSADLFTQIMMVDRSEMVVESFLRDEICNSRITEAMNRVIRKFILV